MGEYAEDPLGEERKQEGESTPADSIGPAPCPTSTHTSNFSLREYVFTSRANGANHNWPFHVKHLDLFTRFGISNVLPPFEPPVVPSFHSHNGGDAFGSPSEEKASIDTSSLKIINRGEEIIEFRSKTCVDKPIVDVIDHVCCLSTYDGTNTHCNDKCLADVAKTSDEVCESATSHELLDSILKTPITRLSSTTRPSKKLKKRKWKLKKRSLADIYTEAKPINHFERDLPEGCTVINGV